jgi:hypothetical protein
MEENEHRGKNEVYSKSVRAGKKRTYFFDVKATRTNDYYLVITESKKKFDDGGVPVYEKHKIFLYREDFDKFIDALNDTVNHISSIAPPLQPRESYTPPDSSGAPPPAASENKSDFTDLSFEDLGGEAPKE